MKKTFLLFVCFAFLVSLTFATHLDDYVSDDEDISVVKHDLLETVTNGSITRYRLNITTLKWFDGKKR